MTRSAHGTNSRYTLGCRCDVCRDAHAAYAAERRRRGPRPLAPAKPPRVTRAMSLINDRDYGLTGGRWVNDRGIQRWVKW